MPTENPVNSQSQLTDEQVYALNVVGALHAALSIGSSGISLHPGSPFTEVQRTEVAAKYHKLLLAL